eukprot:g46322.t1
MPGQTGDKSASILAESLAHLRVAKVNGLTIYGLNRISRKSKPDPQRYEVIKAYVVLSPSYSPSPALAKTLQNFVKERLARHEYPREVEFVESLPTTTTAYRNSLAEQATVTVKHRLDQSLDLVFAFLSLSSSSIVCQEQVEVKSAVGNKAAYLVA